MRICGCENLGCGDVSFWGSHHRPTNSTQMESLCINRRSQGKDQGIWCFGFSGNLLQVRGKLRSFCFYCFAKKGLFFYFLKELAQNHIDFKIYIELLIQIPKLPKIPKVSIFKCLPFPGKLFDRFHFFSTRILSTRCLYGENAR